MAQDDYGSEYRANDDVTFLYDFWEIFQTIFFKEVGLIL